MSRFGDVGPYSPSNVRIVLSGDNIREAVAIRWGLIPEYADDFGEKAAFQAEHGITVLDWLKDAIDWHFKVAPLKMNVGPQAWPEMREAA